MIFRRGKQIFYASFFRQICIPNYCINVVHKTFREEISRISSIPELQIFFLANADALSDEQNLFSLLQKGQKLKNWSLNPIDDLKQLQTKIFSCLPKGIGLDTWLAIIKLFDDVPISEPNILSLFAKKFLTRLVNRSTSELEKLFFKIHPTRILKNQQTLYSVFASHILNALFEKLELEKLTFPKKIRLLQQLSSIEENNLNEAAKNGVKYLRVEFMERTKNMPLGEILELLHEVGVEIGGKSEAVFVDPTLERIVQQICEKSEKIEIEALLDVVR